MSVALSLVLINLTNVWRLFSSQILWLRRSLCGSSYTERESLARSYNRVNSELVSGILIVRYALRLQHLKWRNMRLGSHRERPLIRVKHKLMLLSIQPF